MPGWTDEARAAALAARRANAAGRKTYGTKHGAAAHQSGVEKATKPLVTAAGLKEAATNIGKFGLGAADLALFMSNPIVWVGLHGASTLAHYAANKAMGKSNKTISFGYAPRVTFVGGKGQGRKR